MKILVPIKRVPDPQLKTVVKDNTVDLSNANWTVNPFDEYAVETALRLLENAADGSREGEIIVITIGPKSAEQQLRHGLAMGADRAIRVDAEDTDIDSTIVASVLAGIYEQEKPDLVILGKQAVDGDASQVGQMLAGKLQLPQATFAATVELDAGKKTITVGREVDAGVEYKKFSLPGVVTVDLRVISPFAVQNNISPADHQYQEVRYASLKGIMRAKKKPLDVKELAEFSLPAASAVKELSVTLPPTRPPGQIVDDVSSLMDKLTNEAKAL